MKIISAAFFSRTLGLAALCLALHGRPLWATPQQGTDRNQLQTIINQHYPESTPAGRALRRLLQWSVYQNAQNSLAYAFDDTTISSISIRAGDVTWQFVPLPNRPEGGIVRRISASDQGTHVDLRILTDKDEQGNTIPVRDWDPLDHRIIAWLRELPANNNTPNSTPGGPTPVAPLPSGLSPSIPPRLEIGDGRAYYWQGTDLYRSSDRKKVGYKIEGLEAIFYYGDCEPDASGRHAQQSTWRMASMNGDWLPRSYIEYDLIRSNNIIQVTINNQQHTRLDMRQSIVQITNTSSSGSNPTPGLLLLERPSNGSDRYAVAITGTPAPYRGPLNGQNLQGVPDNTLAAVSPRIEPPQPTSVRPGGEERPREDSPPPRTLWQRFLGLFAWEKPRDTGAIQFARLDSPARRPPNIQTLLDELWNPATRQDALAELCRIYQDPQSTIQQRRTIESALLTLLHQAGGQDRHLAVVVHQTLGDLTMPLDPARPV